MAAKRKNSSHGLTFFGLLASTTSFLRHRYRETAAVLLVAITLIGGGVYLWNWMGPSVNSDARYTLTAERVEVTSQPEWIPVDVKNEVLVYAFQEERSLLDRDLALQMKQAFAMHPWVESVRRVSKHSPPRIVVELTYRRPVAMVVVELDDNNRGLLPVDSKSVLLPSEGFDAEVARSYPRIVVADAVPTGTVGTPWGDQRVLDGARIATVLQSQWHAFDLNGIEEERIDDSGHPLAQTTFSLTTQNGTRIRWGRAPGQELPGEASADEKTARLAEYVRNHGPFGAMQTPVVLDVRNEAGMSTARKPADKNTPL